nr:cytochrome P450 family 716 subfamily A polypeptide 2 [Ipomoea batatas]
MDAFLLYSLVFTVLYVSLSIIYLITKPNTSKPNLPPGSTGWPVVGENIDMMVSGPEKYISDRMKKYSSEVFKTSIAGEKVAVFCGAAGNKFLFTNENTLLTTWWPQSVTKPLMLPTNAQNGLKKITIINRTHVQEILKPENLKHYISTMDSMAKEHLAEEWAPLGEVKVYPLAKYYTFALACKLFLNIEGRDEVKRLLDPLLIVTSGMFTLPLNLPGTAYNRAMKAGSVLRCRLVEVIKKRKAEAMMSKVEEEEGQDVLGRLLSATDEEGQHMNEAQIYNNIIGLIIPSYHSTSAAITFILKYLAELPHIYDQVYTVLRLIPPGQGGFRETVKDFTYAGFIIPKGWKTFWNPYSTHKNPKYFTEPEKFDPSRFEGNGPAPFTFVPFGGGPRMCPGKEYTRLELLVFMHNVVTNFKLEILMPDEKIVYSNGVPIPVNGLPIRFMPH